MHDFELLVLAKESAAEKRMQRNRRTVSVDYGRLEFIYALSQPERIPRTLPSTPSNSPAKFFKVISNRIDAVWGVGKMFGAILAFEPGESGTGYEENAFRHCILTRVRCRRPRQPDTRPPSGQGLLQAQSWVSSQANG